MWGSKSRRIAELTENLTGLNTKYAAACQQVADRTAEVETWKAPARSAERIADDLITRTKQRDEARRLLRETENELGRTRQRVAGSGSRATIADVRALHDTHRRALAQALTCMADCTWEQLVTAAARTYTAADRWMSSAHRAGEERDIVGRRLATYRKSAAQARAVLDRRSDEVPAGLRAELEAWLPEDADAGVEQEVTPA